MPPRLPLRVALAAELATIGGMSLESEDRRNVVCPCEDCGSQLISGLEPFEQDEGASASCERSEWCTNLDCPSNYVIDGLHRVGVNHYLCLECAEMLRTPMSEVFAHLRSHRGQSDRPGEYTYS